MVFICNNEDLFGDLTDQSGQKVIEVGEREWGMRGESINFLD
jgi:hypothetical protein